jgi:hypothetical protein
MANLTHSEIVDFDLDQLPTLKASIPDNQQAKIKNELRQLLKDTLLKLRDEDGKPLSSLISKGFIVHDQLTGEQKYFDSPISCAKHLGFSRPTLHNRFKESNPFFIKDKNLIVLKASS